jgi:uncharacterized protein YndB with AHSA1/START domain
MPGSASTTINGLTVEPRGDLEILMIRDFRAPKRLVFDCWTKPEHVKRWFGPEAWTLDVCDIDLQPGGAYRFHMVRKGSGEEMGIYGEYRSINTPDEFSCTENFEEPYFESMGAGTINTVTLDERDDVTHMVAATLYKSREARDIVLNESGMAEGASESFGRMEALLKTLS